MLTEYKDRFVTETGSKLVERVDYHYQDSSSDKVYILTLQWDEKSGSYGAVCYYGRRGNSLSRNILGYFKYHYEAYKEMNKQLKSKEKKGYKNVGHWVDESLKAMATGALRPEVIQYLQRLYPVGAKIESPSGATGDIFGITKTGFGVMVNGKEVDIPWDKIGHYKVVQYV